MTEVPPTKPPDLKWRLCSERLLREVAKLDPDPRPYPLLPDNDPDIVLLVVDRTEGRRELQIAELAPGYQLASSLQSNRLFFTVLREDVLALFGPPA